MSAGPNVLSAHQGYLFAMRNALTWQLANPASDEHIPINPVLSFTGPLIEYLQKQVTTCDRLHHNIEFDTKIGEGDCTLRTYFRDPFLLLMAFGYVGIPAAWGGVADTITANFSNLNNQDKNIALKMMEKDQSGNCVHNELLFDGGIINAYRWVIEEQEGLFEEIDFTFTQVEINRQPVDIDANFDDQSFDATGVAEVSTVVAKATADCVDGTYFTMEVISALWVRTRYYVYMDVAGDATGDPAPAGYTAIRVDFVNTDATPNITGVDLVTAQHVSDEITAAITAVANVTAANGGGASTTVTITNDIQGDVTDTIDVDTTFTITVTAQGVIDLDGGWSNWDDEYAADDVVLTKDLVIIWGSTAIAGFELINGTLEIPVPKELIFIQRLQTAYDWFNKVRGPFTFRGTGVLTASTNIAEAIAALSSKTAQTLRITYGTTNVGYLEFTNAYLKMDPIGQLSEAGTVSEVTIIIQGGEDSVATYSWTGAVAQDPSDLINHTNT